jgi:N-acetylglucosaminyl-diphospho-decaprenol L-rhamnosyltransferase
MAANVTATISPTSRIKNNTSVSVVIVNHNTRQELQACLGSLEQGKVAKVVVVDNRSSDGSVGMVRSNFPWVTLFSNTSNLGYGAAANQAIAACTTPYVLLLNSDTCLQDGALEALGGYLDQHPQAALVGPRLINSGGILEASCYPFPTPLDTFLENSLSAIFLGRLIRRYVPGIRRLYLRTWPHDAARIVPWVKGAAMAIRREAFNAVGGFDEAFYMYFEDADLCWRLTKAGWQIHFAPVTTVMHIGGASTKQVRAKMAAQLIRSTDLFYRRHNSPLSIAAMTLVLQCLVLTGSIVGYVLLPLTRDPIARNNIAHDLAVKRQLFRRRQR